jgi:hypothetical protein
VLAAGDAGALNSYPHEQTRQMSLARGSPQTGHFSGVMAMACNREMKFSGFACHDVTMSLFVERIIARPLRDFFREGVKGSG